jgi:hypothetical protein
MATDRRWPLDSYEISVSVSAINVSSVNDFRAIGFETVRIGTTRYSGTLWFFNGAPVHGNLPNADAVGYFRRGHFHGFMRPDYFDSVYALLRSERPVVLDFLEEDDGTVVILNLNAIQEPVGEVDRSRPLPDFGFSVRIDELEAVLGNSG